MKIKATTFWYSLSIIAGAFALLAPWYTKELFLVAWGAFTLIQLYHVVMTKKEAKKSDGKPVV